MDKIAIGIKLREMRLKKGVTASEAASHLGVTAQALINYEHGLRIPKDDTKVRIAEYYKKSVNSIFFN